MDSTQRFSDRVANYVKYRPGYPAEMVDFLVARVGDAKTKACADIGSGTGILTRLLLPHFAEVVGVEPNADMRAAGEAHVQGMTNFRSVAAPAEQTGLSDRSIDLVTVSQAFHWFDQAKFRAECQRILKPGGQVALIWNNRLADTPFLARYDEVLKAHATDYNEVNHQNITSAQLRAFFGGDYARADFANAQRFDLDGMFGRLDSSSYAPTPGTPDYEVVRAALAEAFARHSEEGQIEFRYRSEVFVGAPS